MFHLATLNLQMIFFGGYRADGTKGHDHFQADGSSDFGNNHDGDRGRYTLVVFLASVYLAFLIYIKDIV